MSEPKHTTGPWAACKEGDCSCGQVFGGGDKHVATVHASTQDSDGTTYAEWPEEERRANIRLVESAPALLAELERLVEWYGRRDSRPGHQDALAPIEEQEPEIARAMRVIAQARGEVTP